MAAEEDGGAEQEKARLPHKVVTPTQKEIDEHEASSHATYRSWCQDCVAGKGQANPHLASEEDPETPEAHFDYGYMGSRDTECAPMIIGRETKMKNYCATMLLSKGANTYGVSYLVGWIRGLGYRRIVMRSDNEHSLLKLLDMVSQNLPGVEFVVKTSPEGDHAANGTAEAAVREIKNQVRTLRAELTRKYGRDIPETSALLSWLPRHAANAINRYRLGKDGRSAEHRRSGRRWRRPTINFGEKTFYRPVQTKALTKIGRAQMRMLEGIFVGHHERTGAMLFLSPDGVQRGVGLHRKPEKDRYDYDYLLRCIGHPWEARPTARSQRARPMVGPTDAPAVPEMPAPAAAPAAAEGAEGEPPPAIQPPGGGTRRSFYVMKGDIERFGMTDGCTACTNAFLGVPVTTRHTTECRERILGLLRQSVAESDYVRVEAFEARQEGLRRTAPGTFVPARAQPREGTNKRPAADTRSPDTEMADTGIASGTTTAPAPVQLEEQPAAASESRQAHEVRQRQARREADEDAESPRPRAKARPAEARGAKRAGGEPDDAERASRGEQPGQAGPADTSSHMDADVKLVVPATPRGSGAASSSSAGPRRAVLRLRRHSRPTRRCRRVGLTRVR